MAVSPTSARSRTGKPSNQKLEGLDFLRAFFSIAIVALHSNLFSLSSIGFFSLENILAANVAYLAVPVFFQISLFLFYIKSDKLGSSYFIRKRFPKLISLYLFWVLSKVIFDILLTGKSEPLKNSTSSAKVFIEFIVSGGNSPLYFFFSLALMTALTEVTVLCFKKMKSVSLKTSLLYFLFFTSCILIGFFSLFSFFETPTENGSNLAKFAFSLAQWNYNPLVFFPYIFMSAIVAQEFNSGKLKNLTSNLKLKLYVLLSLFFVFTLLEWNFLKDLLHYSRLSLIFGSWLLLYLALLSTQKFPVAVQFISGCSLGIYTFHIFFTHGFFAIGPNLLTHLSGVFPNLKILLEFLMALIASILLTLLFKRTRFLREFV